MNETLPEKSFFFYEGLRANDNQLGDTLQAVFYQEPAIPPHRKGNVWRPPAKIVNEDEAGTIQTGSWQASSVEGYQPGILVNSTTAFASLDYYLKVPFDAWFDIYAYNVTGPLAAKKATYTVYHGQDSMTVTIDQTNSYREGWQQLGTGFLLAGERRIVRLDNRHRLGTEKMTADAIMIMINRKLSQDVIVTDRQDPPNQNSQAVADFTLMQNYPNPFNASTRIRFQIHQAGHVSLAVYDITGRRAAILLDEWQTPGLYDLSFDGSLLSSGVYYYILQQNERQQVRKMVLVK